MIDPLDPLRRDLEKLGSQWHRLFKLDLKGFIRSSRRMRPEWLAVLTPSQKANLYATMEEAIAEINRVVERLGFRR